MPNLGTVLGRAYSLARAAMGRVGRPPRKCDPSDLVGGARSASAKRQGHLAGSRRWWGPFSGSKRNGRRARKPPSNTWIRVPEQTVIGHAHSYQVTQADRDAIRAGSALFFAGKALAKAELICARQGGLEILWYWTARRSNPWVVDDVILPDDQYATSGTCYAAGDEVLAVSRQARRSGRVILGAGHSHGHLGVFSSVTDLELMSQLAAERVGFASQTERTVRGYVKKLSDQAATTDSETAPQAVSAFEITFDESPETWVTVRALADLSADDLDVELDRMQRHQVSFFTTHNADSEHYFPIHHVTSCLHCGTRLEDYSTEDVRIHVIGPKALSEEEQNDLVAELEAKAPRGGFFRQGWGWNRLKEEETVPLAEPADDHEKSDANESEPDSVLDFFVYRRGERVGTIAAAVLEEAAYRCPALARGLGWDGDEPQGESSVQLAAEVAEQPAEQPGTETGDPPSGEDGEVHDDPAGGTR